MTHGADAPLGESAVVLKGLAAVLCLRHEGIPQYLYDGGPAAGGG